MYFSVTPALTWGFKLWPRAKFNKKWKWWWLRWLGFSVFVQWYR